MTNQEIFDKVWNHFVVERKPRSFDYTLDGGCSCRYRDSKGNRCAVGLFIDDADYHPSLEGASVSILVREGRLPTALLAHLPLLRDLQRAHDQLNASRASVSVHALRRVAHTHGLACPVEPFEG